MRFASSHLAAFDRLRTRFAARMAELVSSEDPVLPVRGMGERRVRHREQARFKLFRDRQRFVRTQRIFPKLVQCAYTVVLRKESRTQRIAPNSIENDLALSTRPQLMSTASSETKGSSSGSAAAVEVSDCGIVEKSRLDPPRHLQATRFKGRVAVITGGAQGAVVIASIALAHTLAHVSFAKALALALLAASGRRALLSCCLT